MRRWAKAGVLDSLFEQLQRQSPMQVRIEAFSLDSTERATRSLFAAYWRLVRVEAGPPWSDIQEVGRMFNASLED